MRLRRVFVRDAEVRSEKEIFFRPKGTRKNRDRRRIFSTDLCTVFGLMGQAVARIGG